MSKELFELCNGVDNDKYALETGVHLDTELTISIYDVTKYNLLVAVAYYNDREEEYDPELDSYSTIESYGFDFISIFGKSHAMQIASIMDDLFDFSSWNTDAELTKQLSMAADELSKIKD